MYSHNIKTQQQGRSPLLKYTDFLVTAANNYKYSFKEQLLIHAQKPDATACAEIETWNRLGRWVNKGTRGIALLVDRDTPYKLRHVFDYSDTNSRAGRVVTLWQMRPQFEEPVKESLQDSFGEVELAADFPHFLNPAACINPRGGKAKKEKVALTDKQIGTLLDTIKDLPPYLFVMLGLYAGLRREEILGLQWDCVHIDEDIPYISVRRAWRSVKNRPEVTTVLKTPAAKRDIPIPQILADCLKAEKEKSSSDYVISDSNGEPLSDSQFCRLWHYITVRRVKERKIYRYINGEKIHHTISPKLGERCRTDKSIYYTLDFNVTPHLLRHTYITNLIHEGVDPKTVQYLAGHENSKVTMDIYAKVKYNKPWELAAVVNEAFQPSTEYRENPAS